jgi:hypothetical protein
VAFARLVLHIDWLRQQVPLLWRRPGEISLYPAGLNRTSAGTEWLAADGWQPLPLRGRRGCLVLVAGEEVSGLARLAGLALARAWPDARAAALALGIGPAEGHLAAMAQGDDRAVPVERVSLLGPRWVLLEPPARSKVPVTVGGRPLSLEAIWSRTIGALGESSWRRLCDLAVAVVGCGRTGSLMTAALVRLGVRRLLLVDEDQVEPHNLGEMAWLGRQDLGRRKAVAVAVASQRQSLRSDLAIEAVEASVLSVRALRALQEADLLVCAVDNPAARLYTACLAVLYLRPLLDLGTGILAGPARRGPVIGADVRLVLPGRCLLDWGGVAGWQAARERLLRGQWRSAAGPEDWRRQRQGSLASLNGLAVSLGLRCLEELVRGRLEDSVWLHVEGNDDGVPGMERRRPAGAPECRLCRWSGCGDAGVRALPSLLAAL